MSKEKIMKAIDELPKIHNSISAMNSINIEDLYGAIDRFNKVPTYDDLLKENKQLKDNWNKLKEHIEICINETKQNDVYDRTSYQQGVITGLESSLFKMQELEKGE